MGGVGKTADEALRDLALGALEFVAFDEQDATEVASLRVPTRTAGLSLADRSCLATARRLNLPVLTADGNWSAVDVGVRVEQIR
jgi:ribonuclease VapC